MIYYSQKYFFSISWKLFSCRESSFGDICIKWHHFQPRNPNYVSYVYDAIKPNNAKNRKCVPKCNGSSITNYQQTETEKKNQNQNY